MGDQFLLYIYHLFFGLLFEPVQILLDE